MACFSPLRLFFFVVILCSSLGLERRGFAGSSPAAAEKAQQDQHQKMWCVAKNNAEDGALQAAIDWACGPGGADCGPIQEGGDCFDPEDIQSHASYAFNDYFLKHGLDPQACVFSGAAEVTMLNPSQGKCVLPSGSFAQNSNITGSSRSFAGQSEPDLSKGFNGRGWVWPLTLLVPLLTGRWMIR